MSLPITVEYRQRLLKNLLSGCSSEVYFILLLLRASSHQPEALCAFSDQTTLFINAFAFMKLMNASYTRFPTMSTPVFQKLLKSKQKFLLAYSHPVFSILKKQRHSFFRVYTLNINVYFYPSPISPLYGRPKPCYDKIIL